MDRGLREELKFHWGQGRRFGFPTCCIVRFLAGTVVHRVTDPPVYDVYGFRDRLRTTLNPRYVMGDGLVPCEYHVLKYLLTGSKKGWRNEQEPDMCCERRKTLEEAGLIRLDRLSAYDESVWMFAWLSESGRSLGEINVERCPWCGGPLG